DMVVLLFGEDEGKRGVFYGSDITAEEDGFLIPDVGRAADDISKIVVLANFGSGQDFGDVECRSDLRALKLPYEAVMSNQEASR
ncbi:MAG: hypothetical protein K2H15_04050, partial [Muribaculaceae bacterium]|nr:hypothetical protein [Muribaculaceae bacterium]